MRNSFSLNLIGGNVGFEEPQVSMHFVKRCVNKIVFKLSSSFGFCMNRYEIASKSRMDEKKLAVAFVFNYDCKYVFGDFNLEQILGYLLGAINRQLNFFVIIFNYDTFLQKMHYFIICFETPPLNLTQNFSITLNTMEIFFNYSIPLEVVMFSFRKNTLMKIVQKGYVG